MAYDVGTDTPYSNEGTEMQHLQVEAKATVTDQGVFSALFATYALDRTKERITPGAFEDTISTWQASGKRIPLHWEHSSRPEDIIGYIDPKSMKEMADGVYVEGQLDLKDSEVAREVWRSMKNDAIGLSFGYLVQDQTENDDGSKDLKKLDLFEITLSAKPVNADTRVLSMKSVEEVLAQPALDGSDAPNILIVDPDSLFVKASTAPWDGSAGRFTDEQYARSAILDRAKCGEQGKNLPAKQRYSLPIREPGGALNANAVHAAAGRINQVDACGAAKASAKNALRRAYGELGEEAPDSLKHLEPEPAEPEEEDFAVEEAVLSTEDEDAGEEAEQHKAQPRAQDPLADEVTREVMEMRLRHTRVFNPLPEE